MLTKFRLRDEEKGIVDLPSSITKRNLFEKWSFIRGWGAIPHNHGTSVYE
jgi:hypothetical protein